MTQIATYGIGLLACAIWIPLLFEFCRSWLGRGNPVSASICALMLCTIYSASAGFWADSVDHDFIFNSSNVFRILVGAHFYGAFRIAKHRFKDRRSNGSRE